MKFFYDNIFIKFLNQFLKSYENFDKNVNFFTKVFNLNNFFLITERF